MVDEFSWLTQLLGTVINSLDAVSASLGARRLAQGGIQNSL